MTNDTLIGKHKKGVEVRRKEKEEGEEGGDSGRREEGEGGRYCDFTEK